MSECVKLYACCILLGRQCSCEGNSRSNQSEDGQLGSRAAQGHC